MSFTSFSVTGVDGNAATHRSRERAGLLDWEESPKRQRVALACTTCRNRKQKCDGIRPRCSSCRELGARCSYEHAPRRRPTVPPSGYEDRFKAIENALQALAQQNKPEQGVENVLPAQLYNALKRTLPHDDSEREQQLADTATDGMATVAAAVPYGARLFGPSSTISFLQDIGKWTSSILKSVGKTATLQHTTLVSRAPSPTTMTHVSVTESTGYIDPHALPSDARAAVLLDVFFHDMGTSFQFIYKRHVMEYYETVRSSGFRNVRKSFLCLLNVIFAFATYLGNPQARTPEENFIEAEKFFTRSAELSHQRDAQSVNVETVQYMLLLSQYSQGTQRSDKTWSYHSLATQKAIHLGLNSVSSFQGLTPVDQEIRKRVWYACVVLDRTICMTFGCPPMIPNQYIRVDLPSASSLESMDIIDGPPAQQRTEPVPDTVCFFIATIKLFIILGHVIEAVYSNNLDHFSDIDLPKKVIPDVVTMEEKLQTWTDELMPDLDLATHSQGRISAATAVPDSNFAGLSVILRLRYLNIRLLLHRPLLTYMVRARMAGSSTNERSLSENSFSTQVVKLSVETCRDSASETVDIIHDKPTTAGASWYSAYYAFNAALVIFSCFWLRWMDNDGAGNRSQDLLQLSHAQRKAMEILGQFDCVARPSRKIQRTLHRLVTFCKIIAQTDPTLGNEIVDVLQGYSVQSRQLEPLGIQHQDAVILDSVENVGLEPKTTAGGHTSMSNFALGESETMGYWTTSSDGLDLFDSADIDHSWMMADADLFPQFNQI